MKRTKFIFLTCFIFLIGVFQIFGQDVVYHLNCRHYKTPLTIDSLVFINLNNQTSLAFSGINQSSFSINLSEQLLVNKNSDKNWQPRIFKVLQNLPGIFKVKIPLNEEIICEVYKLSGEKLYSKHIFSGINNLLEIRIGESNVYLVRLQSQNGTLNEKVIGRNKNSEIGIRSYTWFKNIENVNEKSGNYSAFDFNFQPGDSLKVLVFKTDYHPDSLTFKITASDTLNFLLEKKGFEYMGKYYKTAIINGREWMAENMAYKVDEGCWVYNNIDTLVEKYGFLYSWEKAMEICPKKWRLPTDEEWEELATFISNDNGGYKKVVDDWYGVGKHLKSTFGWNLVGNGTDDYGFNGFPGGVRTNDGNFDAEFSIGYWWCFTQYSNEKAYYWYLKSWDTFLHRNYYAKTSAISVRCIKNN